MANGIWRATRLIMGDTGPELDPGHHLRRESRYLLLPGTLEFSEVRSVTRHLACHGELRRSTAALVLGSAVRRRRNVREPPLAGALVYS